MPDLPDDPRREDGRTEQQARQVSEPYATLMQQFGQYQNQGFDEFDALKDLAETFAGMDFDDDEIDDALPVVAGIAARAIARPLLGRGAQRLPRWHGRACSWMACS